MRTGHRQRRTPLSCAGFGGQRLEFLLFRIIYLRRRGIELVAAGSVVALKFVVDFRRRIQRLFEIVRPDKRRRAENAVKILYLFRNVDIAVSRVEFLITQFLTEDRQQIVPADRLMGARMQVGIGLLLHIRPQVVPLLRHLLFGKIHTIRDLAHFSSSFL